MRRILAIGTALACLAGCYRSYSRSTESGPAECGNGVVEPGEECDGDLGTCTGEDMCPGFRWCDEDCTWGECTTGGFGILAGPVVLTDELELEDITSTSTEWTGDVFGVSFAADAAAYFGRVSVEAERDGLPHQVMPGSFHVSAIETSYRDASDAYGTVMVLDEPTNPLLINLLDPDGWPLIDPGVSTSSGEVLGLDIVAGAESFGAAWADLHASRVFFASLTPDIGIIFPVMLDEISDFPFHRLPSLVENDAGFAILWHVDDPAGGNSALSFARLSNDSDLISGIHALFAEDEPQPPSALDRGGGGYGLVYATQPYFDAPVLDLHLAVVDEDGGLLAGPVDAGRVLRHENHDADLAWSGTEHGVVLATPLAEEPGATRTLALWRVTPEGAVIGGEFRISVSGDVAMPAMAWDGEGYGVTYSVQREDRADVEFIRLGCIPPD